MEETRRGRGRVCRRGRGVDAREDEPLNLRRDPRDREIAARRRRIRELERQLAEARTAAANEEREEKSASLGSSSTSNDDEGFYPWEILNQRNRRAGLKPDRSYQTLGMKINLPEFKGISYPYEFIDWLYRDVVEENVDPVYDDYEDYDDVEQYTSESDMLRMHCDVVEEDVAPVYDDYEDYDEGLEDHLTEGEEITYTDSGGSLVVRGGFAEAIILTTDEAAGRVIGSRWLEKKSEQKIEVQELAIVPGNSIVYFEVEMVSFVKEKESWDMNTQEKIEEAGKKKKRREIDKADLVNDLHVRLNRHHLDGDKMNFVCIDKVQDLTMGQLALFKYICRNVDEGFVFSGDTAQAIAKGVDFRFEGLRSLFDTEFLMDSNSDGRKKNKGLLASVFQLLQNRGVSVILGPSDLRKEPKSYLLSHSEFQDEVKHFGISVASSSREEMAAPVKLSRYLARVVLCAYMVLGHPDSVFTKRGQSEIALAESAGTFVKEFELLLKIIIGCFIKSTEEEGPPRLSFSSQLKAFGKAWCSYLFHFVLWKVMDVKLLEEDLISSSCPLLKPENVHENDFDFGICLDALQSWVTEKRNFFSKLSYCFWWGLRNLSSLGQDLKTSNLLGEILFAIFNCITDPLLGSAGISISEQFTQVEGHILPTPKLRVGDKQDLFPRNGRWNFNQKRFVEPVKLERWAAVNFSARCDVWKLCMDLQRCGGMKGILINLPFDRIFEENQQFRHSPAAVRVEEMLEALKLGLPEPPQFLLCILPEKKNSDLYGLSKLYGMNSFLTMELVPTIPLISRAPTLIVGMDVSHGSPGRVDAPSVAAVVSSRQWPLILRYRAAVCTQSPKLEMKDSLHKKVSDTEDEGLFRELLKDFYSSSKNVKPAHIIIFRDGVGESQFNQVINIELNQIIEACNQLEEDWCPKFTVIVAPICYAHLAAAQVAQFIKFDELTEATSSRGVATAVVFQSLHCLDFTRMFAAQCLLLNYWKFTAGCVMMTGGLISTFCLSHSWWRKLSYACFRL